MFIATLSLCGSMLHAYLFTRSIDAAQRNVARGEYLRTCKDLIDGYFQAKLKISVIGSRKAEGGGAKSMEELDAAAAVSRFGALGTYLANYQGEEARVRYTELTRTLSGAIDTAASGNTSNLTGQLERADQLFGQMNDDCVRTSQLMGL
jgi:hypothetical protein